MNEQTAVLLEQAVERSARYALGTNPHVPPYALPVQPLRHDVDGDLRLDEVAVGLVSSDPPPYVARAHVGDGGIRPSRDGDEVDLLPDLVEIAPFGRPPLDVSAGDEEELHVGRERAQVLDRPDGEAHPPQLALDLEDTDGEAHLLERQPAHRQPVVEWLQRLSERVLEAGDRPDLVGEAPAEDPPADGRMADVGRVERAAEEGDATPWRFCPEDHQTPLRSVRWSH